jgi:hypothetical protein
MVLIKITTTMVYSIRTLHYYVQGIAQKVLCLHLLILFPLAPAVSYKERYQLSQGFDTSELILNQRRQEDVNPIYLKETEHL